MTMTITDFSNELHNAYDEIWKLLENNNGYCGWEWFKNLWDNNDDEETFYNDFIKPYFKDTKWEKSFSQWDEAWQYRTILHEDYKQAKIELVNAILGWYQEKQNK